MNYVIAVLTDRIQAETAYSKLEQEGLPPEQLSIVGKGYKGEDAFDFINPRKRARNRATLMSYWLIPFGFIGGVAFNLSTQYQLVPEAGLLGNQLLGGLFGAIAGAMGSYFVGGGINFGKSDEISYHNELKAGKYLVIANGAANLTNKAASILRDCKPEDLQGFVDPTKV